MKQQQGAGIALSSTDGETWSPQSLEALRHGDAPVTRIVIGAVGGNKAVEASAALLAAVEEHRTTLTHLHLWGIANLAELPALPDPLQCLDLRNCTALTELPALPERLQTLDLGGCRSLAGLPAAAPERLTRLHLDGCAALPAYAINTLLAGSPRLEEITLSGCEGLHEIEGLERHARAEPAPPLRKLVLAGCSNLVRLPDLSGFRHLGHLNLNGCRRLEALPEVHVSQQSAPAQPEPETPAPEWGLQYLVTHDCPALRSYRGLDIRAVHRSADEDDNITDTVRALRHLGEPPAELLSSKLLLLGSGRVGKTTLAKALQWASLDQQERESPKGEALDPVKGSDSTHGIQFWKWPGDFRMPDGPGDGQGTVHIWDFAGQEIYHNTHRMFAAAGSVFVIVCTDRDTHRARLDAEIQEEGHDGTALESFEKENQYRELRYWLDYVRGALGRSMQEVAELPILLVHGGPRGADLAYVREQAGPYAALIDDGTLRVHALDCSNHAFAGSDGLRDLRNDLAQRLGHSADGLGIRVPAFYQAVHQWVEARLPRPDPPFHAFDGWRDALRRDLAGPFPDLAFQKSVMHAVTRYLHRIGQVFWLNERDGGDVLVDQGLGAQAIYDLCAYSRARKLHRTAGRFDTETLATLLHDSVSANSIGLDRLLRLLQKCDICAPDGRGGYQALHPDVLSPWKPELERATRAQWFAVSRTGRGHVNHCYRLSGSDGMMVGAADFQAVAAWVARESADGSLPARLRREDEDHDAEARGARAHRDPHWRIEPFFWRDGLQVGLFPGDGERERDDGRDRDAPLVLRIRFEREREQSFEGSLYVELLTADEDASAPRLRAALVDDGGPLRTLRGHLQEDDQRPENWPPSQAHWLRDEAMWPWLHPRAPTPGARRHDVAISFRGVDIDIAAPLHAALESAGLHAYYYREDERLKLVEAGNGSRISEIYGYLDGARCLIVVCSKDYFDLAGVEPRRGNVYCPVELAAAAVSVSKDKDPRPASRVFHFARTGAGFDWRQFDALARTTLEEFQKTVIRPRERASELDDYEDAQVVRANRDLRDFIEGCGSNAKQAVLWDESAPQTLDGKIDEMVARVRNALNET